MVHLRANTVGIFRFIFVRSGALLPFTRIFEFFLDECGDQAHPDSQHSRKTMKWPFANSSLPQANILSAAGLHSTIWGVHSLSRMRTASGRLPGSEGKLIPWGLVGTVLSVKV